MDGGFMIPAPGDEGGATPRGGLSHFGGPGSPRYDSAVSHTSARGNGRESAESELRQVAETLSKTGKVLGAGLAQANEQGQRLRGAISRLERANEWSTAERKRAEEEISSFFSVLREALRSKEDEMLRDTRAVFAVQDEDNKRRLEELVIQGQKLSRGCMAIQSLHEGTSNATLGSLNAPLQQLLEALETSGKLLEREDEASERESARAAAAGVGDYPREERGVRFTLCTDLDIQREIEGISMVQFESHIPPLVLVGTPASLDEEARRRRLTREDASKPVSAKANGVSPSPAQSQRKQPAIGAQQSTPDRGTSNSGSAARLRGSDPFPAQPQGKFLSPQRRGPSYSNAAPVPEVTIKAVIPYEEGLDNEGVIYYLGRSCNSKPFSNPALFSPDDPNLVVLRASSRIEGDLASLAAFRHHDGAYFETDSALSSWISVELPMPLAPTHYTLGYFINGQEHVPRNWVLQGSRDNVSFTTLKVHESDSSLDDEMHLATWRIPEQAISGGPFSYFRIMQTGPTSTGTMFLVLSFVEFYGTLFAPN